MRMKEARSLEGKIAEVCGLIADRQRGGWGWRQTDPLYEELDGLCEKLVAEGAVDERGAHAFPPAATASILSAMLVEERRRSEYLGACVWGARVRMHKGVAHVVFDVGRGRGNRFNENLQLPEVLAYSRATAEMLREARAARKAVEEDCARRGLEGPRVGPAADGTVVVSGSVPGQAQHYIEYGRGATELYAWLSCRPGRKENEKG